ncbi:hypothetical protein BSLG_003824 [Batrachochytrium salamandrivorans]|nr:hypothetical protein BSLG_003824 [Batrachochytrium salamandrivorans]
MASQYLERVRQNAVNDTLAQSQWAEHKWVWIVDKDQGYLQGSICKENGDEVEVQLEDGSKRTVNVNDTEKMNPPKFDKVEDMADLTHLNEASVVHNLRQRYYSNLIYGRVRRKDGEYQKVIQYLASAASLGSSKGLGKLEQQILQANPILESFGNAQTIRNNNSSRFGKFIRIEFSPSGHITGGNIDKYLLEKSRVTHQSPKERNYHIFYQVLKGTSPEVKKALLIDGSASTIVLQRDPIRTLMGLTMPLILRPYRLESLKVMGFTEEDQNNLIRVVSAVLHLGNLTLEADREDNATFTAQAPAIAEKICHVLGIPVADFSRSLLKPRIKAGRDHMQARNVEQVYYSVEALSRSLYERMFSQLVDKINSALYTPAQKSNFIGVLDIAGFEIFESNSFEQLCINYTNERLQQFFNHHMFILEQEEYKRENIDWKFIDFGLDLQPSIELIEKTSPIGILSLLDEECVMPKATDKTFIDKLNGLWKGKSPKYDTPRFNMGFILQHYAGKVEYSVSGWLDKNKDPLNDNVTRLLANSSEKYIENCLAIRSEIKRQESLILLVLDQLRCNGVLEGIRICRAGFPNRVLFQDFRVRYEVLSPGVIPKGFMDGRKAAHLMLEHLALDKNQYRIGSSKVFFRSGVLADLENLRDEKISKIVVRIQALMRGYLARKIYKRRIDQLRAIKIIQKNARIYVSLREWAWWKLYTKVKPLLNVTRTDEELRKREALAKEWEDKAKKEQEERAKLELLRVALEMEKKRVEELLIQEQNAAANQSEILVRTQKREVDLNDRLKEILAEIEEKDATNDSLSLIRTKLEEELKNLRSQLESGEIAFERLDKEKQHRETRLKEVEEELTSERCPIRFAKVQSKLQSNIADLEQRLEQDQEEKHRIDQRRASLEQELLKAKEAIIELERAKAELETLLKKRESEIVLLNNHIASELAEKDSIDKSRRELQLKVNSLAEELETEKEST